MALKETIIAAGLIKTALKVWDRWKQRKHERWIKRLERDRENLQYEKWTITGEINDIDIELAKNRELESC